MPFTPAHIVAVLPILRPLGGVRLDATCLVIGTMAPDFEYFARGELVSRVSHTFLGLLTWNLPATLVLAAMWHLAVKWPTLALLPRPLAARAVPLFGQPWQRTWNATAVVTIIVSALLGALTHLLWDGVTHFDGVFASRIPALHAEHTLPGGTQMPLARILQHTSTAIGLLILALYLVRSLSRIEPIALDDAPPRARALLVFAVTLAITLALSVVRVRSKHLFDPGSMIAGMITGLLFGVIIASLVTRRTGDAMERAAALPRPAAP